MITMVFDVDRAYDVLATHMQKRVHRQEPLAQHSTFGVGGVADIWLTVKTKEELTNLVSLCAQEHWPLLAVGSGTNILYADAGVRGIVAHIGLDNYHIEEQADGSALLVAESGVHWTRLLRDLVPLGWGGLEFSVGIPGTVGGGVVSNAGAHHRELGQILEWIDVLDARGSNVAAEDEFGPPLMRHYRQEQLDLGYRHSRFREQRLTHINAQGQMIFPSHGLIDPAELIVTVALRLTRQDPKVLLALLDKNKQERKQADPAQRHAGSIFKDLPKQSADDLINRAGLRGKTHGKAQISEHNANYIINLGGATAQDIVSLIIEAHQRVLEQSGVHLALNVELLGAWQ
jgi:UDP-N-acetylmuramate dehydrogenase